MIASIYKETVQFFLIRLRLFFTTTVLLCSIHSNSLAQNTQEQQVDSLLKVIALTKEDTLKAKVYRRLTQMLAYNDYERSLQFAEAAIEHSRKAKDKKGETDGLSNLFNVHYLWGIPMDSLLMDLKNLEDHVRSIGDSVGMIKVYDKYALYYSRTGQIDQELEYELKNLQLIRTYLKEPEAEARCLTNIGVSFNVMEQLDKAVEYFNRSLALNPENAHIKAKTHFQLGAVYFKLNQLDSSKVYFDRARTFFESENNLLEIVKVEISVGRIHDALEQFEKAELNYRKAFQLAKENDIKILLAETYAAFASHYYARKSYKQVIEYGEQYLEEIAINQNYFVQAEYLEMLHDSYAKLGKYKEAYMVRDSLAALKDSIKTADHLEQLMELEAKFQVEEEKNKNQLLAAENLIARNNLRLTQLIAAGLLIALLLAGGWGYSIFRARQREKEYNQKLEATVKERTFELSTSNKNLQQANYELRIFNYIASHDIKEPIRNISSYVSLIQKRLPLDIKETLNDYFDFVKHSTVQLYTLIEDFARYTSLSKGEKVQLQPVDLQELVDHVTQTLEPKIKEYSAQIIYQKLPIIHSNQSLLFSALKSLIENGLKFNTSLTPTVEISCNSTASHHEIIITDNGVGIDAEHQDKAFEMFKRLHNKEQFDNQGSGIGLAIVKLIADKLEGEIHVKSTIGEGSTFVLTLPRRH